MAQQTSLIPGEDELKKLCEERDELESKLKPLLDLIKSNAQFLVKYSPFCHDVYFRSNHLTAARANTAIAMQQAEELNQGAVKLGDAFGRIFTVEAEIERLKEELNASTNGEYQRSHPELWGTAPEQLEAEADDILEAQGLDAETGAVPVEAQSDGENIWDAI